MLPAISSDTVKTVATIIGVFLAAFGLLLNAYATLKNVNSRKLLNYQEIVKSHRELWKLALDKPDKFSRVLLPEPHLEEAPITDEERRFMNLLFLHMTSAFYFSKSNDIVQIEKLHEDVLGLLSLPIPRTIWHETSRYFNQDFVQFVEARELKRK